ncbi:hypothetical protein QUF99_11125 [Bacillus sp. DX4.1]|uniref:hypothetical protein n=1 Tax=Bacillus sp. DX4.1 TaxID=3055867 RepID=UPI0025A17DF0|nr:hypothetical protein [Bacillus sp. DX4.1]MDM5187861.1 hypothetical protein [Bacillus sp. DX4.1]
MNSAVLQMKEEIKVETRREKIEKQLREAIDNYMEGNYTIDEAMYKLLHQSSPIKGWLKKKAKRFLDGNYDISIRYEVDDIYSLLTEELWEFVAESSNRYEEILNYVTVLNYRCDLRLTDFKRYFLAEKRTVERVTNPKDDETLDYVELSTQANGNYSVSTYRSGDSEEENEVGQASRRKFLVTGYGEEVLENRVLITEMLESPALNEKDQRLLKYLYRYPDASLSEIAMDCGYTSKKAASRGIKRIARQLIYLIRY